MENIIDKLLDKEGLSRKQLANNLLMSYERISSIIRNEREPYYYEAVKIAKALKSSPEKVFDVDSAQPSSAYLDLDVD